MGAYQVAVQFLMIQDEEEKEQDEFFSKQNDHYFNILQQNILNSKYSGSMTLATEFSALDVFNTSNSDFLFFK